MAAPNQHLIDLDEKIGHEHNKGSLAGKCLNRDHSVAPSSDSRSSCSHRWQAYEQMASEADYYAWPKYKPLADRASETINVWAPGIAWYARRSLPKPVANEWDYGNSCKRRVWFIVKNVKNFYERSSAPYNHQAHHVIPNGEFSDTITEKFKNVSPRAVISVRKGLLKAGYNLNYKINVIMLPMDKLVADTIGLPRHQSSWTARSHRAWSELVKSRLEQIFNPVKEQIKAHEKRDYDVARSDLESLSESLRKDILGSGASTLDALAATLPPTT